MIEEFVSRELEVTHLVDLLVRDDATGAVPVAVVSGPPGVGKTALATKVGYLLKTQFPDGQWFVGLGGVSAPRQPDELLPELLRMAGVHEAAIPRGLEQQAAELRARLAGRRVLLVLDDAAATQQIRPLLPGAAGCAVLVTSRRLLTSLAGAEAVTRLEPLSPSAAMDMMNRLVGERRVADEQQAASDVGAYCGRLPLALRIAGARLAAHPEWPIERFAARLRDQRARLDQLAIDDLSVRASVELSYQALDDRLGLAFRRIGHLGTRTFSTWAVRVLTGVDDAESVVDDLVAANLVQVVSADPAAQPRYRMHDLVATYAGELAEGDDPDQTRAALRRHLQALLALSGAPYQMLACGAEGLPPWDYGPDDVLSDDELALSRQDPRGWLVGERGQLVDAIERACERGWCEAVAALAERVLGLLEMDLGDVETARLWAMIRDAARAGGHDLVAWRAECRRCLLLARADDLAGAADGLVECAAGFERLRAWPEVAYTLAEAATYRLWQDHPKTAVALAERAYDIARRYASPRIDCSVSRELAGVLASTGDYGRALVLFEQSLRLADEIGIESYRVSALLRLAASAFDNSDLERSTAACREAERLINEARSPVGMAWLRNRSARIAFARGRHDEGIELGKAAAETFARVGDARGLATAQATLAEAG